MAEKKIILLPSWYPSEASPVAGIFVQDQAECLAKRFDVTVMMPSFGPFSRSEKNGVTVWRLPWACWLPRRDLPLSSHLFEQRHRLMLKSWWWAATLRHGLRRYIGEKGLPDLLHAHVSLPAGAAAVHLGRAYGVPVAVTEHSSAFGAYLEVRAQRRLVGEMLHHAARVVAVSPHLAGILQRHYPALPVQVLGNVVRDSQFTLSKTVREPGRRFIFFSLCLLREGKGIQFLLAAAQLLVARGLADFELVIGGDGPYRGALEAQADALGLRPHCRFTGQLERAEACAWMQQCDAFVLPSLGETFGVVLGEAMACGKPVIATRCGGPDTLVTAEAGCLVPVADALALAAAMEEFLRHPGRFDAARIRASVSERFGEEAFLRNISALYAGMA